MFHLKSDIIDLNLTIGSIARDIGGINRLNGA